MMKKLKIVVVGGGAGGLPLVTKLGKKLGKKSIAEIHLIDLNPTHIWKPLLHEVAAGSLDSHKDEINFVSHGKKNGYNFHLGEITALDKDKKTIDLAPLYDSRTNEVIHKHRSINYDYLVLSIGSRSNSFGVKGIDEYCFHLDNRSDADYFHEMLLKNLVKLAETNNAEPLEIAIMGGGATGVELAAELVYSIKEITKMLDLKSVIGKDINITLIEAGPSVLNGLSPYIQEGVSENLEKLNIKILTNKRVTNITNEAIEIAGSEPIKAKIKVWSCGILAQPVTKTFKLEVNKINQIITKRNLECVDDKHIFAIGDCASVPIDDKGKKFAPARASNSLQQADFLTTYFSTLVKNKETNTLFYKYKDYGSLISVSKFNAFGKISSGGRIAVKIDGFNGRIAYWSLYQKHLLAIHGWFNFWFFHIASFYSSRVQPRIKLH